MDCDACESTFERYDAEWENQPDGLRLSCPSCGDLLRYYELTENEVRVPVSIS